jgi:hypothetical protein
MGFMKAIETLRFPEPWDIDDFQDVLDRLKADGYYLFKGELFEAPRATKGPTSVIGLLGSPLQCLKS